MTSILISLGCGSSKDATVVQRMTFDIVDSLLAEEYVITGAGKSFCPPKDFAAVPDTILASMRARMEQSLGPDSDVRLAQIFFDSAAQAGVMVSIVHNLTLTSDTGAFFARYRRSLQDMYGQDQLKEGEYWIEDVFVKNHLVTDANTVRFQLICLSNDADAAEITYFSPSVNYPNLIMRFESSIGTIRLTQKGG